MGFLLPPLPGWDELLSTLVVNPALKLAGGGFRSVSGAVWHRAAQLCSPLCAPCSAAGAGRTREIPLLSRDLTGKPLVQCLFCMSYDARTLAASFS